MMLQNLSKMLWNTPPAINNPSNFKWSKGIDPLSQRAPHILIQNLHWQLISNAFGWPKITCRENGRKGLETNHSQRIQALEMSAFFKSIKEHLLKTLHPLHFLHLKRFCYCYQMEPYCLTLKKKKKGNQRMIHTIHNDHPEQKFAC